MSLNLRYLRRNVRYVYLRLISRKSDVASIMRISMMNKTAFTPLFIYNIANLGKTDNNRYFIRLKTCQTEDFIVPLRLSITVVGNILAEKVNTEGFILIMTMIKNKIQHIIFLLSSEENSSMADGKILPCANLLHAKALVIVLISVIMLVACERHTPTWKQILSALIEYRNGRYKNALHHYEIFLKELEIKDNGYFESVREFLTSKISGTINPDKYEAIKAEFESDNIFSNLALPNCPHCEKCPVIEKCISKRNIDFAIEYMKKCNVNSLKNNQYGKN